MRKLFTLLTVLFYTTGFGQTIPEILYYRFDGTGTTVPNLAITPPIGTETAYIMGGITQGQTGQCSGALIGSGITSSTDYLNTGYITNLTGSSWTISMWTKNITPSSTLFYIFGDASASSFRCFTNGVAGANNWILRGAFTDVLVNGGATVAPHVTTFVYDNTLGNIKAYLDGVLVNTVSEPSVAISGSGPFKVMGYGNNVGSPAGGLLDEFRMYNRALSASEVMELYNLNNANTISVTACDSYTVPSGHETYYSGGTVMDTIPRAYCGDSILTINLTINHSNSGDTTATVCDNFFWHGNTYTTSGTPTHVFQNAAGCDSTVTLNLTINYSNTGDTTTTACNSFIWHGTTYTTSGTPTHVFQNAAGCDSTVTLNLTINYSNTGDTAATACNSFIWHGTTYTTSGTPTHVFQNAAGCDSIVTLNLTINYSNTGDTTVSACNSFIWHGVTYTASGTPTHVFQNAAGCDSIVTLNLTINYSNTGDTTATACNSFIWHGTNYSASGTPIHVFQNAAGCDSTVTLNLTINYSVFAGTDSTDTIISNLHPSVDLFSYIGSIYTTGGIWLDIDNTQALTGSIFSTNSVPQSVNYHFAYKVSGIAPCVNDTAFVSLFVEQDGGVSENMFKNIIIYPNPTKENIIIEGLQSGNIEVINLKGQAVKTLAISGNKTTIGLSDIPAGVYSLKIKTDNGIIVKKLIKQ